MKNKGFTLVELLAVIVVLTIVSLIGYAAVGNVIESSKESAAERNLENFEDALQQRYLVMQMNGQAINTEDLYNATVKNFSGTVPKYSDNLIQINNNKVELASIVTMDDLRCSKKR